jgi:hypothetical protein
VSGSVSVALTSVKNALDQIPLVSRGNYVVTGLIVRAFFPSSLRGLMLTFHGLGGDGSCPVWYVIGTSASPYGPDADAHHFNFSEATAVGTDVFCVLLS